MKIKCISFTKPKRTIYLTVILFLLIFTYVILNFYSSSEAVSHKIVFESNVQNYEFVLGGQACGIKLLATGVLIVELDNPDCGLQVGDIILKIDDTVIESNAELISYINRQEVIKKGKVKITFERNKKNKEIYMLPTKNESTGKYELGLWVKDSSAGVGMITFYEKNNKYFAGLGHGITETSKNMVLPISSGAIVRAKITDINMAVPKKPGDLRGTIYKEVIGQIRKNTSNGIYGILENDNALIEGKSIQAANKDEIKEGNATIYCTLDNNEVNEYDIKVRSVMLNSVGNKNMIIEITDEKLLEKTGGIVQGMSGSPIVQNGKLIGAITHVFLNEPKRGYAVFIENMIEDMESLN